MVGSILNRVVENRSAILGLATIKSYDEYTSFHSVNVLILSLALGSMLPLDRQCMMILGTGALLHDIGKVTIPQSIIAKQGPLSSSEWDLMRDHPVIGADILVNQPGLNPLSVVIAFEHHMRYDLKGYPEVSEMGGLSLFSRIVEICRRLRRHDHRPPLPEGQGPPAGHAHPGQFDTSCAMLFGYCWQSTAWKSCTNHSFHVLKINLSPREIII